VEDGIQDRFAVDEHHQVRVLLNGARFAQVRKPGPAVAAALLPANADARRNGQNDTKVNLIDALL
jgi:hypothetical protein